MYSTDETNNFNPITNFSFFSVYLVQFSIYFAVRYTQT